jgi:hypothetical protein
MAIISGAARLSGLFLQTTLSILVVLSGAACIAWGCTVLPIFMHGQSPANCAAGDQWAIVRDQAVRRHSAGGSEFVRRMSGVAAQWCGYRSFEAIRNCCGASPETACLRKDAIASPGRSQCPQLQPNAVFPVVVAILAGGSRKRVK